jgi:hypothetical protein
MYLPNLTLVGNRPRKGIAYSQCSFQRYQGTNGRSKFAGPRGLPSVSIVRFGSSTIATTTSHLTHSCSRPLFSALDESFRPLLADHSSSMLMSMSMWHGGGKPTQAPAPSLPQDTVVPVNGNIVSDAPTTPPENSNIANDDGKSTISPAQKESSLKTAQSSNTSSLSAGQTALVAVMVVVAASLVGAFVYQYHKHRKASETGRPIRLVETEMDTEEAGEMHRVGNQALVLDGESNIEV